MDDEADRDLTVLQCKFQAYLSWSQPFLHELLTGVGRHVRNVVVCGRAENEDRFPVEHRVRLPKASLVRPSRALLTAARLEARWKPRVIHAHFGWSGIRMLLLKHFLGIPMVTTFGGRDLALQAEVPDWKPLYDALLQASDRIFCVSESLRRTALARGADPARTEVVRRGTRLDRFRAVDRSARDPDRPLGVLMVGRFVEKKGHRDALCAVARLVSEGRRIELRMVGEGEEEPRIRRLAGELGLAKQVRFIGILRHEAVRREMERADVLLHCSVTPPSGDREGLPNAVVEAAATGLPVVGTRHGGIVEAVQDQRTGLLVEEGDVAGLSRALGRLASDVGLRRSLGEAAARRMRAEFDLGRQVERHVEVYRELARAPRAQTTSRSVVALFQEQLDPFVARPQEFSIAELIDAYLAPERWAEEGWPRLLERAYELKRHVPASVKYPVKRGIGGLVHTLAGKRIGLRPPEGADLDRAVLEDFGARVALRQVDPRWTPPALARSWPALVAGAREGTRDGVPGRAGGADR